MTVMSLQDLVAFKGETVIGIPIRQRLLGTSFQLVALVGAKWSKLMMLTASSVLTPLEDSTSNSCSLCWAPVAHPCL